MVSRTSVAMYRPSPTIVQRARSRRGGAGKRVVLRVQETRGIREVARRRDRGRERVSYQPPAADLPEHTEQPIRTSESDILNGGGGRTVDDGREEKREGSVTDTNAHCVLTVSDLRPDNWGGCAPANCLGRCGPGAPGFDDASKGPALLSFDLSLFGRRITLNPFRPAAAAPTAYG
jgi:hypothetical protein